MIPVTHMTYTLADKFENKYENGLPYPTESLNTLTEGYVLPDHNLIVRVFQVFVF